MPLEIPASRNPRQRFYELRPALQHRIDPRFLNLQDKLLESSDSQRLDEIGTDFVMRYFNFVALLIRRREDNHHQIRAVGQLAKSPEDINSVNPWHPKIEESQDRKRVVISIRKWRVPFKIIQRLTAIPDAHNIHGHGGFSQGVLE